MTARTPRQRSSSPAPRPAPAAGGRTGTLGSTSAAASASPRRRPWARMAVARSAMRPVRTCMRTCMRSLEERAVESEIRTIEVAGQLVGGALYGSAGAARTLLVFNGIGASLETVAPFATQFRETRVVTFDVPGVGGSPTPALPYRF